MKTSSNRRLRRLAGIALGGTLALAMPAPGSAQAVSGDVAGSRMVRGELIRLLGARADVSVTWPNIDEVPDGVWARTGGPTLPLVSNGSQAAEADVRRVLEERPEISGVERSSGLAATDPFGIEITVDDAVRFFWRDRTETFAIQVLGEARRVVEDFELTVRMPHAGVIGDMWGLQAELSRAGIRRVRFVAGP